MKRAQVTGLISRSSTSSVAVLAALGFMFVTTPVQASTHEDAPVLQQKAIVVEAPAGELEAHVDAAVQKLASESWRVVSVTPVPAVAPQTPTASKSVRKMYKPKHLAYHRKARPETGESVVASTVQVLIVAESETATTAVVD